MIMVNSDNDKQIVTRFFCATNIPNPRHRVKVLYARAYEMSITQLKLAVREWNDKRNGRLNRLIELQAPQVIIDIEREIRMKGMVTSVLNKVLKEKGYTENDILKKEEN